MSFLSRLFRSRPGGAYDGEGASHAICVRRRIDGYTVFHSFVVDDLESFTVRWCKQCGLSFRLDEATDSWLLMGEGGYEAGVELTAIATDHPRHGSASKAK